MGLSRITKVSGYFINKVVNETGMDLRKRIADITPMTQHLHITTKDMELEDDDPIFEKNCDLAYCERFFSTSMTPDLIIGGREVKAGEKYRHFKEGMVVTVIGVGQLSESPGSYMVVYYHEGDPNNIWIRPYDMFVSPTDKLKYPNATQYFRFEKIEE